MFHYIILDQYFLREDEIMHFFVHLKAIALVALKNLASLKFLFDQKPQINSLRIYFSQLSDDINQLVKLAVYLKKEKIMKKNLEILLKND